MKDWVRDTLVQRAVNIRSVLEAGGWAEKMCISRHSAKETIAVYFALGCTHAQEIDVTHATEAPRDMQPEFDLT